MWIEKGSFGNYVSSTGGLSYLSLMSLLSFIDRAGHFDSPVTVPDSTDLTSMTWRISPKSRQVSPKCLQVPVIQLKSQSQFQSFGPAKSSHSRDRDWDSCRQEQHSFIEIENYDIETCSTPPTSLTYVSLLWITLISCRYWKLTCSTLLPVTIPPPFPPSSRTPPPFSPLEVEKGLLRLERLAR